MFVFQVLSRLLLLIFIYKHLIHANETGCKDHDEKSCKDNILSCRISKKVQRLCPVTCNTCKEQVAKCADKYVECSQYNHTCFYSSFTRRNCKLTCGLCAFKITKEIGICRDILSQCKKIATAIHCKYNPFVKQKCQKSCGTCTPKNVTSETSTLSTHHNTTIIHENTTKSIIETTENSVGAHNVTIVDEKSSSISSEAVSTILPTSQQSLPSSSSNVTEVNNNNHKSTIKTS